MKNRFIKAMKNFWIIRLYKWITKDKSLCKSCYKQKADEDLNGLCFDCYFKSLRKTR